MKTFLSLALAATVVGVGLGAAVAADGPIKERRAILKSWGDVSKPIGPMLKGEAPFNLETAQKALTAYVEGSAKLPALFPAGSDVGETDALPAIWKDKAKFDGIFKKLGDEAAAAQASIKDEASFKAAFPKLFGNCKACHDDYRKKKS